MARDEVAPTAGTLEYLLACQRRFGGSPPRVVNFTAAGYRWRLYYRHLGEEGIAFPDSSQEERYRGLSDEERSEVAAKLRALVDGADLERIRRQTRNGRFEGGIRLSVGQARRPVPDLATGLLHRARGTSRMHRARSVARSGASSRDGPSDEPPLASRTRPNGRGASACQRFWSVA
jgi:hypothetical protein